MTHDYLRPYGPSGEGPSGWQVRNPAVLELALPRNANAVTPVAGSTAYAFGSYVELSASLAADFYPHHLNVMQGAVVQGAQTTTIGIEYEIAVGAAGSEVLYGRAVDWVLADVSSTGGVATLLGSRCYDMGTDPIPAGSRVAMRVRKSVADAVATGHFTAYLAGYEGTVPDTDDTYSLAAHLGGGVAPQTLVTPFGSTLSITSGASFAYGSWVEVMASAAADLAIVAAAYQAAILSGNRSHYLQLGIGAAASETPYAMIPMPGRSFVGIGHYKLRRPLLVLAGERVAARSAGAASAKLCQFTYQLL